MLGWLGVHAAPMLGLDIHDPGNSLNRISRWCCLDQAIWWLPHKGFGYRERRFGDRSEVVTPLKSTGQSWLLAAQIEKNIKKRTSRQTATLPLARVMSI